ncbi:MAG: hypothetical protein LC102_13315 [Ignavibacteriales bacterium]|jgi:uncharacterized membrane protein|nr:MAG: hypothetical protein F9K26_00805 [Ignavibacteriaceae bacterium]MBW7871949.1 hypothetical protein [Ignavibacteria bacterium]MCZ2144393.1 hypothetical protein [Ignavibacteriales bacterium]MBV6446154.1 hypothetical protein [Ignavibacteriaceae bacterium]MBZ0197436.1 hypothetical protein [Ignavibacteriaceae bacterium]
MELIPILATIILVATISTFFLSIGAYILFKVREAQGVRAKATQPATIQAELVTPELASDQTSATMSTRETVRRTGPPAAFEVTHAPAYRRTTVPGRATGSMVMDSPPAAQQFTQSRREAPLSAVTTSAKKFVRVTSETTQERAQATTQQQVRQGGNLKWR